MVNIKSTITQAVIRQWNTAGTSQNVRWPNEPPEKDNHYQCTVEISSAEKKSIGIHGNVIAAGEFIVEAWIKRATGIGDAETMLAVIDDYFKHGTVLTEDGISIVFGVPEPTNDDSQDGFFVSALAFPFTTHYDLT